MNKKQNFIKKFNNHADYETFTGSTDFVRPNVSACVEKKEIHYNSINVSVTGVELDEDEISIAVGNEKQLVATVQPSDARNKSVTWSSSDDGIASVNENGVVTANAEGECVITVTTEDGNFTATCSVTITAE